MNKRAAVIAWQLVMEHNRIVKTLTPLVTEGENNEAHDAAYKRSLELMYAIIHQFVIDGPVAGDIEELMASKGFVFPNK